MPTVWCTVLVERCTWRHAEKSDDEMVMLKQKNAVAESFGYFFDEEGKVVYKIPRIGLQLKTYKKFLCRRNCGRQNESQSHSRIYEKHQNKRGSSQMKLPQTRF